MIHSYHVSVAKDVGIKEAVILYNLAFWIQKNIANEKHFYDGRYWTYNSLSAFCDLFPELTVKQIRIALDNLISKGYLITGNYNKTQYDRTLWYSFTDLTINSFPELGVKSICQNGKIHLPDRANGFSQKGKPIPDINSDNLTDKRERESTPTFASPMLPEPDPFLAHNPHKLDPAKVTDYVKTNAIKLAQWEALQEDISKITERGPTAQAVFDIVCRRAWKSAREDFSEIKQLITASQQKPLKSDYSKSGKPSVNWVDIQNQAEDELALEGILKYDENYDSLLIQKMNGLAKKMEETP